MAIKYVHWIKSFVNICLYLCILAEFTYSDDVPYTLTKVPSSKLEVVLDGHGIYKRDVSNVTSSDNSTMTGTSNAPPVTTAAPVTANVATAAPGSSTPKQTTASPTTTKFTTPYPIDQIMDPVNHKYYKSVVYSFANDNVFYQPVEDFKTHKTLDNNHRVAITVNLPFSFRFYGHQITNFTIATGGFLYMSPFLHKFLTATQYIAPLMANFDTRLGADSRIYHKGFNDRYVVEWSNVYLQDQNHSNPFSFQTTLHSNGTIVFAYKSIPLPIKSISTSNHPVKIGLSDAFYIDTKVGGITRRTIYEYHRIQVNVSLISQNVAVLLHPEKTCNLADSCHKCVTQEDSFDCKWCNGVGRCSDGLDWHRQEWRNSNCNDLATNDKSCPVPSEYTVPIAGIIVIVIILLALIGGIGGWVYYAYTHPQSASGMWLMEHRPSQMKSKLATMKFWKKDTGSGEKYRIESEA